MSKYYLLVYLSSLYLSSLTTHRCEMCTAPAAHEDLAQLTLGSKPLETVDETIADETADPNC